MTDSTVPNHLHVVVESTGEQVTFLPHYFSTSCQHERHEECKGKCKFCEERCRCPHHKEALGAESVGYMFGGGKYHIRRGETMEVPTEEARGLALSLKAYGGAEWPGLRCWPKPGEPDTTVVSWLDDPGAET